MSCDQGSLDCMVSQNVSMYCNSRCDRWKETKIGLGLNSLIVVKCVVNSGTTQAELLLSNSFLSITFRYVQVIIIVITEVDFEPQHVWGQKRPYICYSRLFVKRFLCYWTGTQCPRLEHKQIHT